MNRKAITNIPGYSALFTSNELSSAAQAYVYVPLIYRALRLRCNSLASVPIAITGRGEAEKEWPFPSKLSTLIWYTEAALLLRGMAFWEKVGNPVGKVTDVKWRNPYSMKLEYKDNKLVIEQENVKGAKWTNDLQKGVYEMVYFHEFHPTNDITDGVGAVENAMGDAQLIRYLTRFASIFFEQGAQPLTLLGFDEAPTSEEKTRTEAFFRRAAKGIRNAWRVFAFRGGVDVHTITPPVKDLVIPELQKQARENIAQAFEVPQTMLSEGANYAVSKEHRESFWQDTIRPRSLIYEDVINTQLLDKFGLEFTFNFDEMDIFQEDEAERAQSLNNLVMAGIPQKLALELLGYDLTDEQWTEYFPEIELEPDIIPAKTGSLLADDLRKWKSKATNRMKEGKPEKMGFSSKVIPPVLEGAIEGALEEASSIEDINSVFDNIWMGYP